MSAVQELNKTAANESLAPIKDKESAEKTSQVDASQESHTSEDNNTESSATETDLAEELSELESDSDEDAHWRARGKPNVRVTANAQSVRR